MNTFQEVTVFEVEECCNCHVRFGMTRELRAQRLNDGKVFYCPNGHGQHFTESQEAKWRKALENARSTTDYYRNEAHTARMSLRAAKGQVTKLKKKIMAGQCPCCEKQFMNLERHMAKRHPELVEVEKDVQNN